jgi:hypothetical protein
MPPLLRPTNVCLSAEQSRDLGDLAARMNRSRSGVIRELINYAADMAFRNRPRCALGKDCLVPHLHPVLPPAPEHPMQTQFPA